MTIRYTTNLTFEEQIHHWENGNSEEAALAQWLQARRIDIEESTVAGVRDSIYDEGYDAGYKDGLNER